MGNKNKKLVKETILCVTSNERIKVKELDFDFTTLQEDDVIDSGYEDPFYSENNSYDGYYYFKIIRFRPETPEEEKIRLAKDSRRLLKMKLRRYKHYLDLKKEFLF